MAKPSPHLPRDIIEAILSKSSVKPLLRFQSVSKSWNALISDPLFIKIHHHNSKSSNSQALFIRDEPFPGVYTVVKLVDQKLEIVQELETAPYDCTYFICHCEGVLLLRDDWFNRHVLWNPSTRTHTKIWIPYKCLKASYGLCYDPNTHNLKLVIVEIDKYSVFTCNNKSLMTRTEKFSGPYTDYGHIYRNQGVCVDGAIYWVWSHKNVTKLIYYDPRDDKFKILEKPENVKGGIFLADFGGFLCLRCEGRDWNTIKIWIKEKGIDNNLWKDFMTIENVKMCISHFEPQCLVGDKILIRNRNRFCTKLVFYDPIEKTFEQFGEMTVLVSYLDSPFFLVKTKPTNFGELFELQEISS